MRKKFHDLLHQYKVDAFKITHNQDSIDSATAEILDFTDQALNNAYHYHFHQEPSPERLETFTMIKNFTLESLMPPVVDKIMRRVICLEKQHEMMVELVDGLLEALSEDPSVKRDVG